MIPMGTLGDFRATLGDSRACSGKLGLNKVKKHFLMQVVHNHTLTLTHTRLEEAYIVLK